MSEARRDLYRIGRCYQQRKISITLEWKSTRSPKIDGGGCLARFTDRHVEDTSMGQCDLHCIEKHIPVQYPTVPKARAHTIVLFQILGQDVNHVAHTQYLKATLRSVQSDKLTVITKAITFSYLRSPKSPKPGTMYDFSFKPWSIHPVIWWHELISTP